MRYRLPCPRGTGQRLMYAHPRVAKYKWCCLCALIPHDTVFEHPLNLSMLLGGGGRTKQDIFSHCEWTRVLSSSKLHSSGQCVVHMLHQSSCRSNTFATLAMEGDRPFSDYHTFNYGMHCMSRILLDLNAKGWYNSSVRVYMSEFDSKQVPWGSYEKNFGNIVIRAFSRCSWYGHDMFVLRDCVVHADIHWACNAYDIASVWYGTRVSQHFSIMTDMH